tara:strand:+ start:399 stop:527 length:129 start_codon:yes stop_codon:yes gene_type:complete
MGVGLPIEVLQAEKVLITGKEGLLSIFISLSHSDEQFVQGYL